MRHAEQSPVVGYKIAIVSGADLRNEFKVISPEVKDEEGNVTQQEVKERQFIFASKRQMRAVRKARKLIGSHKSVMLFGQRKDGTHFPVSLKIRKPMFTKRQVQEEAVA